MASPEPEHVRFVDIVMFRATEQWEFMRSHLGGFYLPNCNRDGRFDTITGKAHFNIAEVHEIKLMRGELLMMTIRSHDQFNTTFMG